MKKIALTVTAAALVLTGPALALEYSGNLAGAKQAQPALRKLVCSPQLFGAGQNCALNAVRLIGDWAWVSWSSGEAGGTSVLRRGGKGW